MAILIGFLVLAVIFIVSKYAGYLFFRTKADTYDDFDFLERNLLLPGIGIFLLIGLSFFLGVAVSLANIIGVAILGGK